MKSGRGIGEFVGTGLVPVRGCLNLFRNSEFPKT